jgi:hypothetical protein
MTRHPSLGTPFDALEAAEVIEENSDDEADIDEDEDDDDDDEDEDEDEDVQWE